MHYVPSHRHLGICAINGGGMSITGEDRASEAARGSSWASRRNRSNPAPPYPPDSADLAESGEAGLTAEDRGNVHVLVVDDDRTLVEVCREVLKSEGYQVTTCERGPDALDLVRRRNFQVALIDLHLPRVSGLQVMSAGLKANPALVPIIMTGDSSIESGVEALNQGAFTYLPKPFSASHLKLFVGQASYYALAAEELKEKRETFHAAGATDHPDILGESPALKRTMALATRTAGTDASVFIYGGSGTGKDLIAYFIHERSRRADRPILAVNCAALPESLLESEMFGHRKGAFTGAVKEHQGLLEAADGGTLFLDEVTEMSLAIQAKLLRVIQDGKVRRVGSDRVDATVNVRFIAATNQNPDEAVAAGRLREDLYYRLRVVPVVVPPLRERVQDIPTLAEHFLSEYWRKHRPKGAPVPMLSLDAIRELQGRKWYGNVRELQNVIEHLVVLTDPGAEIKAEDIPAFGTATAPAQELGSPSFKGGRYHETRQELLDHFEKEYLGWVVQEANGNMSRAARIADVDRTTLYRLMERHDLSIHREVRREQAEAE